MQTMWTGTNWNRIEIPRAKREREKKNLTVEVTLTMFDDNDDGNDLLSSICDLMLHR